MAVLVIAGISGVWNKLKPQRATIGGKDEGDADVTIRIGQNAQVFDRLEFNDFADEIDFDKYHEAPLMRAMLRYKDHPLMKLVRQ